MFGVFVRRLATVVGSGALVALPLSSCSTTGFREAPYTSPEESGARHQNVFYTDTPAIYLIAKYANGRQDATARVYVRPIIVGGQPVSFPKVNAGDRVHAGSFLIHDDVLPPAGANGGTLAVKFPDPPTTERFNPADPNNPITQTPPRTVGRFRFEVELADERQSVEFVVLQGRNAVVGDDQTPLPGNCAEDNLSKCPPADPIAHEVQCCTTAQTCGLGVDGTGLCYGD